MKFKAFADNKLNVTKFMISVYDSVENIVGKGENAGYQHFLLSPHCFQRLFSQGGSKLGLCGKEWSLKVITNLGKILAICNFLVL